MKNSNKMKEQNGQWVWGDNHKLLIYYNKESKDREKIAGFDLDGTLIIPKSGKKFGQDGNDWKLIYDDDTIKTKMTKLSKEGYKIVIFTNQLGVEKKHFSLETLKAKLENIIDRLALPIDIYISLTYDQYRKPNRGMWESLMETYKNKMITVSKEKSFYVGDAAGRPKNWKKGASKDHSSCDRKFALNIGIKFYTPEEFFLNEKTYPLSDCNLGFDPSTVLSLPSSNILPIKNCQELVLLVGYPASGKSTLANNIFKKANYICVSKDSLQKWSTVVNVVKLALQRGYSVCVDNTHPTIESRKRFLDLIPKNKEIHRRCIYLDTPLEICCHLNMMRERLSKGENKHIPLVAYYKFRKDFEKPSLNEGFDHIDHLSFSPSLLSSLQQEFLQWTESSR